VNAAVDVGLTRRHDQQVTGTVARASTSNRDRIFEDKRFVDQDRPIRRQTTSRPRRASERKLFPSRGPDRVGVAFHARPPSPNIVRRANQYRIPGSATATAARLVGEGRLRRRVGECRASSHNELQPAAVLGRVDRTRTGTQNANAPSLRGPRELLATEFVAQPRPTIRTRARLRGRRRPATRTLFKDSLR